MKKIRIAFICIGCCCIIAAATLSMYNRHISSKAADEADELISSFASLLQSGAVAPEEIIPDTDPGLDSSAEIENEEDQPDTVTVGVYEICGEISMPSIGIDMAVISDWSYPNLNISACRYSGTPENQLILMAHNYDRHFGRLSSLSFGDEVHFTDVYGAVHSYAVSGAETRATNQLGEIIRGGDWDLTLFTCTYGGANRVVVRCVRIDAPAESSDNADSIIHD